MNKTGKSKFLISTFLIVAFSALVLSACAPASVPVGEQRPIVIIRPLWGSEIPVDATITPQYLGQWITVTVSSVEYDERNSATKITGALNITAPSGCKPSGGEFDGDLITVSWECGNDFIQQSITEITIPQTDNVYKEWWKHISLLPEVPVEVVSLAQSQ